MSELNRLVIRAFRVWCRRNLRPVCAKATNEDAMAFFAGLAPEGAIVPLGSWEAVHGALRQAGLVADATACISVARVLAHPSRPKGLRSP